MFLTSLSNWRLSGRKHGSIWRYQEEKTQLTGIAEEVWHYRYVGAKAAAEMYERGPAWRNTWTVRAGPARIDYCIICHIVV